VLLFESGAGGQQLSWTGDSEGVLGISLMEMPARLESWLEWIAPADRMRVRRAHEANMHPNQVVRDRYRVVLPNGRCNRVVETLGWFAPDRVLGQITPEPSETALSDQMKQVVDGLGMGIVLTDECGRILFVNHGLEQMFGYRSVELVGQSIEVLIPEAARGTHRGHVEQFCQAPAARMMGGRELQGRHKDGRVVPVAVGLSPLREGNRLKIACTLMDLSAVKRAERDLVRFFELSLDLFLIAGLNGIIHRCNANFTQVLGYREEQFVGHSFMEFVHPEDHEATLEAVKDLRSGLPVVQFRNRYVDAGGRPRAFEWTAQSIVDEGLIFAVARDITDRALIEERLQYQEARERAILNNTTAVIYVKNLEGRYEFVNHQWTRVFGNSLMEVVGKTDEDLFPPEFAREFRKLDQEVIQTRRVLEREEQVPHADGRHTYISVKFPLQDRAGEVCALAGISTDITDQLRMREAEHQMGLARLVQQRLYPRSAPELAGFEVAGASVPVTHLCGDYFDFIRLDAQRVVLAVGDVSGHGLGPALNMVEVRALLRMLLREGKQLFLVLEQLNGLLYEDLPDESFVSLALLELDSSLNRVLYAGAGQGALRFRRDGGVEELDATGPVLGVTRFTEFDQRLLKNHQVGELLLLATDGIVEAISARDELFGKHRLFETMRSLREEATPEILERLFAAVNRFAEPRDLHDDMTAIVARVAGR
jgi:sigma-B regulation protein RsbU (phosphoserine phosphatase)